MAKASDKSIPFTVRLEHDIYFQLEEYCRKTGASRSGGVERAVAFFLSHVSVTVKATKGLDWRTVTK